MFRHLRGESSETGALVTIWRKSSMIDAAQSDLPKPRQFGKGRASPKGRGD
jgi:hypothetical protein